MAQSKIGGFLVHTIILVILFLSLINIVFSFHAKMLIGEVLLLMFFILIAFISMAGKLGANNWSNGGLFFLYGLNLVNFIFIWLIDGRIPSGTIILTIIGFLIAMIAFKTYEEEDDFEDNFEEIQAPKEESPAVTSSFEPGKYVASKTGKKFHVPKCDWAKKINKSRQVWFNDQDEAKQKGLKPCDCVK